MSDELFSDSEVSMKSPKLLWMARRDVMTVNKGDHWIACVAVQIRDGQVLCDKEYRGETEDDAIVELAKDKGWRIWGEE